MEKDLLKIKEWAENIAGNWDGDLPGRQEDRAQQAQEIIEAVDHLQKLIDGMEEL